MSTLTPNQFQKLDHAAKVKYLAGGRAGAREMFEFEPVPKSGWVPRIRGLNFGDKLYDTEEEAIEKAKQLIKGWKGE